MSVMEPQISEKLQGDVTSALEPTMSNKAEEQRFPNLHSQRSSPRNTDMRQDFENNATKNLVGD